MADKKKAKQRMTEEENKVTKEEYAVAKYLRFGLPVREGKLHGMEVKCFIANAAIDKLLESKWSSSKNRIDPLFTNRASCSFYMNVLLEKGLFHRADRDKRKKDKESTKKKKREKDAEKEEPSGEDELRQRKGKKEKKSKREKEKEDKSEKNKDDATEGKEEKKKDEKKKKEKRLKLLMSENQWFEDGDEVYVWIYDPVNIKTFLIGLLMVLGAISLCMFPLWPEEVRIGVYYLSLAAAGFVGFILFLAVVRLILFCCVWALTMGKHHFWFLPNLTEDVGFFDSFRPLYKHDVVTKEDEEGGDSKKKKKKKKSDDDQDKTETKDQVEKSSDKDDSDEFEVIKKEDLDEKEKENSGDEDGEEDEEEENDVDEDESEDIEEDDSSVKEDKKSK